MYATHQTSRIVPVALYMERRMKSIVFAILACATAFSAHAEIENFDSTNPGALPDGWEAGVTGSGNPRWAVGADPAAPSGKNVLQQTGRGTFPWCVKKNASLADGFGESIQFAYNILDCLGCCSADQTGRQLSCD